MFKKEEKKKGTRFHTLGNQNIRYNGGELLLTETLFSYSINFSNRFFNL